MHSYGFILSSWQNNSTGQEAGEIDSTIPSTENVETTKENVSSIQVIQHSVYGHIQM